MSTTSVIVYHSGYGHTLKQAEAVHRGASSVANHTSHLIAINPEGNLTPQDWELCKNADAIIFGSPTYMGGASWQFKKFADASSKTWMTQDWKNKIAAGFTNSGSLNGDKFSTIQYFFTLAMQHSMIWVGLGLMPSGEKKSTRDDTNSLGGFAGALSHSPVDASAEEAPTMGDLKTAEMLGVRIAEMSKKIQPSSLK